MEKYGVFLFVIIVFVVVAIVFGYLWFLWIVAGIFISMIGYTGPDVFVLQVFILLMINGVILMINRIGKNNVCVT
jgi:hypothetical protein